MQSSTQLDNVCKHITTKTGQGQSHMWSITVIEIYNVMQCDVCAKEGCHVETQATLTQFAGLLRLSTIDCNA